MSKKLFTNCHIVDVVNKAVTEGSVLVEDGVITAVGNDAEAGDAQVIDLGGKYVMPGLFNCHTHMCMPPDPAVNYNRSDAQITMLALKHLRQHLNTGVTFIRDVGGMDYIDIDIRNAAKKGEIVAPDMQVSGKCICMTGGHGWQMGREADGVDDCKKAAREQLRAGADWIKVMGTGGVMTEGVEPGSPQLDEDELRAAIAEGHKVGAKSCTHSQGMTGIKNALRAGVDSIEHGFYMDDWCFDWMKEHNVFYVPTLAAMYWIKVNGTAAGIPEYAVRKVNATFEDHLSTFRNAYKAGVKIVLGTDAGTPFNPHDKTAYEMILMTNAGMDVWDALRAGTIVAAEMCGVDKTHGSIETGKRANLAVFAEDPTKNLETVMDCQMTVLGGEIVYQA
ncbi:MAG TPA: amidohydrolase family protein [Candidatus Lachnoclostridium pullistercoris]|uniref:Amidohydrolase family protein n=1 Tax=Candidatus Lachnoclostridium pullistercoris TaxID=2838632 RepID=A0A9D2PDI8_9FIRM|nr:amidohydrolase family protein [Candidatus Lachnoclostridium pullistercoris]